MNFRPYHLPATAILREFRPSEHAAFGAMMHTACKPAEIRMDQPPIVRDFLGVTASFAFRRSHAAPDCGFLIIETERWALVFDREIYGSTTIDRPVRGWIVGDIAQFDLDLSMIRMCFT